MSDSGESARRQAEQERTRQAVEQSRQREQAQRETAARQSQAEKATEAKRAQEARAAHERQEIAARRVAEARGTSEQAAALERFRKKQKNATEIQSRELPNGLRAFVAHEPARLPTHKPGTWVEYTKQVDNTGATILMDKTRYNADGSVRDNHPKGPAPRPVQGGR